MAYNDANKRGSRMSDSELKALLDAEKMSALASIWSSKLSADRDDALMYYTNDLSRDMPAADGRSQAVSSDTADCIEGLMPGLIEIFVGSEDVVVFDPVGPEDVAAAEQETDFVNHVFMQDNPGFLNLYTFIKDALLSKVGILKVWWEHTDEIEDERYKGLTEDQMGMIAQDKDVEILEHEEHEVDDPALARALQPPTAPPPGPTGAPQAGPQGGAFTPPPPAPQGPPGMGSPPEGGPMGGGPTIKLHDVKVRRSKTRGRVKIMPVAPEEFGIEKTARRLTQHECNYCFHRVIITVNRLLAQGYDADVLSELPTYTAISMPEEINRDTVAEHQNVGSEHNPAARRIEIG